MKKCSVCGMALPDEAQFCGACGGAVVDVQPEVQAPVYEAYAPVPAPQPKKGISLGKLIPVAVALVAVLVIVLGLLTNWFGLVHPLKKVGKAIMKTVNADSLTVTVTSKYTYDDDTEKSKTTYSYTADKEKENLTYAIEKEDYGRLYENGDIYFYYEEDGDIDYANKNESDEKKPNKDIFDAYNDIVSKDNIDWEEVVKHTGIEGAIDKKKINSFMEELLNEYLGDTKWLKENLGYEKKGGVYTFTPDIENLGEELLDILDDSKAIEDDYKDYIEEYIDMIVDNAEDDDIRLTVSITVKKGVVSNINLEAKGDDTKSEIDITITDYNKTKTTGSKIKDKVEEYLEDHACVECGEFGDYERGDDLYCSECYYACPDCGEEGDYSKYDSETDSNYYYCYDCYYKCVNCGEYGEYYYDGDNYCHDCYYRECYGYVDCEVCGELCDAYDHNGQELCYDCYYDALYNCVECDNYGSHIRDGKRYCTDHARCEICGGSGGTYSYAGYYMCWDCYWDY